MKKILMLFALMLTFSAATYAQKVYYKCTGDNVRVRMQPSTSAKLVQYNDVEIVEPGPVYLQTGDFVTSKGVKRNGFVQVYYHGESNLWNVGWVSEKYLKLAKQCTKCKGQGHLGGVCPDCKGEGDEYCCNWTGKKLCPECYGVGYK